MSVHGSAGSEVFSGWVIQVALNGTRDCMLK